LSNNRWPWYWQATRRWAFWRRLPEWILWVSQLTAWCIRAWRGLLAGCCRAKKPGNES